jgi:hypothetical protein
MRCKRNYWRIRTVFDPPVVVTWRAGGAQQVAEEYASDLTARLPANIRMKQGPTIGVKHLGNRHGDRMSSAHAKSFVFGVIGGYGATGSVVVAELSRSRLGPILIGGATGSSRSAGTNISQCP